MSNRFKHTFVVTKVIDYFSENSDYIQDAVLIEQGWWPTKMETTNTSVIWVGTEPIDSPSIKVPTGCADREEWIRNTVKRLVDEWHNGNRSFVHEELTKMPNEVSVAVAAGVAFLVMDGERFYFGMKERA